MSCLVLFANFLLSNVGPEFVCSVADSDSNIKHRVPICLDVLKKILCEMMVFNTENLIIFIL